MTDFKFGDIVLVPFPFVVIGSNCSNWDQIRMALT